MTDLVLRVVHLIFCVFGIGPAMNSIKGMVYSLLKNGVIGNLGKCI